MTRSLSNNSKSRSSVLELVDIVKTYNSGNTIFNALDGVSLNIRRGEFVSITGPSGSGKSTLMHIIGLLDNPTSGKVLLEGQDISHLNENEMAKVRNVTLGFVFQQFNLLAKTSSLENVILPLLYSDVPRNQHHQMGLNLLEKVGLSSKSANTPAQLSGGQQQRVAIARALATNVKLILADEPTGNLDTETEREIVSIFKKLAKEYDCCVIVVTHNDDVAKTSDVQLRLTEGKLVPVKG